MQRLILTVQMIGENRTLKRKILKIPTESKPYRAVGTTQWRSAGLAHMRPWHKNCEEEKPKSTSLKY